LHGVYSLDVATKSVTISDRLITDITSRLAQDQPVRRTLPDGGRIHIDRQMPFLVIYRPPPDREDSGTSRFIRGEASYLVAPRHRRHSGRLSALAGAVAGELAGVFGGFLVIELWSDPRPVEPRAEGDGLAQPRFRVVVPRRDQDEPSVVRLVSSLGRMRVHGRRAEVELVPGGRLSPPGLTRLERSFGTAQSPVRLVGIEITPVYRNPTTDELYPDVVRSIHRQLSVAIQQAAYEFAIHQTTHRPRHYQALGRRSFVKAVGQVDGKLAEVAGAFDLLLAVSPVNSERAYASFRRRRAQQPPRFRYRPLDVEPDLLLRKLYQVPIERVEDPTLAAIFSEKQRELALKLNLLADRGSPRFLPTGLALYGDVEAEMVAEAEELLRSLDTRSPESTRSVSAPVFADAAQREIAHYRSLHPQITARVEVRDDVGSVMVSNGNLLVGSKLRIPTRRIEALVQHEVGTHVVTYWNGMAQRLKLLATGLAGHDELQEGLAVLAEYLVAGLTPSRLRTVAARVVAARSILDGAEFLDTYRLLVDEYGFAARTAFQITTRVHRGGGFVKDAVYLRGLKRVVAYLAEGGRLDTLLVGKIAVDHVAVIEELQRRGVLRPPPLRPAYLDDPDTHYRLERLRGDVSLSGLADRI
jgi:uncharacterized protein (TIGR02421 family)